MIMKGNRKRAVLINVCRILDSESGGANSSKTQYVREIGRVQSARKMRKEQLKVLAEYVKRCAATDVIVAGDLNGRVSSENTNNFMNETGLCDLFQEMNGAETEK